MPAKEKNKQELVKIPDDITLKQMWEEVPASLTKKVLGYGVAIFLSGFALGEFQLLDRFFTSSYESTSISDMPESVSDNQEIDEFSDFKDSTTNFDLYETAIREIREESGVAKLGDLQNDLTTDRIPAGHFGFTYDFYIEDYIVESDPIKIWQKGGANYFEVHKITDLTLHVVLFGTEIDVVSLSDPSRSRNEYQLFSKPHSDLLPVLIDLASVRNFKSRDLPNDQGNIVDLELNSGNE